VAALSEWLQLMLAEIARKREEGERAQAEQEAREREARAVRAAGARTQPGDLNAS
jgi:hypothetical protein